MSQWTSKTDDTLLAHQSSLMEICKHKQYAPVQLFVWLEHLMAGAPISRGGFHPSAPPLLTSKLFGNSLFPASENLWPFRLWGVRACTSDCYYPGTDGRHSHGLDHCPGKYWKFSELIDCPSPVINHYVSMVVMGCSSHGWVCCSTRLPSASAWKLWTVKFLK